MIKIYGGNKEECHKRKDKIFIESLTSGKKVVEIASALNLSIKTIKRMKLRFNIGEYAEILNRNRSENPKKNRKIILRSVTIYC